MTTSRINTLPAPQSAVERHNRLGKKIGVALGVGAVSLGAWMAHAGNEAARHDVADMAVAAPDGSDLARRADTVSNQNVVMSFDVDALGKLTKREAPGDTPNRAQAALDRVNDDMYLAEAGLTTAAIGGLVAGSAGAKLRGKD